MVAQLEKAATADLSENVIPLTFYVETALFIKDKQLVKQIEYYFSDENLPGDDFLFNKTMKRNSTAWVPIRSLQTFRKVKVLNFSDQDISWAINRYSTELQVDKARKNIRRKRALKRYLADEEKVVSRSLRIDNLAPNTSATSLETFFRQFGALRCVRIVNVTKDKSATNEYAIAEFENKYEALKAMKGIKQETNWRTGFKVAHLPSTPTKDKAKSLKNKENIGEINGNVKRNLFRKPAKPAWKAVQHNATKA